MADNIAHAVTDAGLPSTSVPEFLGDLLSQNTTGLPLVSGVTPDIIGSGVGAMLDTYIKGFRNVWATAAAFVGLAAIGECASNPHLRLFLTCCGISPVR